MKHSPSGHIRKWTIAAITMMTSTWGFLQAEPTQVPHPQALSGSSQELRDLDLLFHNYIEPADQPTPPAHAYELPKAHVEPNAQSPVVADHTRQSQSSRSFSITGDRLQSPKAWLYHQTNVNNGRFMPADILSQDEHTLNVVYPPHRPYGMWLAWIQNDQGISQPIKINATEAWWIGPKHGVTGSEISIYGRNLSFENKNVKSYVYMRPWGSDASTASKLCSVTEVNPYKVSFTIPTSLTANQSYEVWVHNGHGGKYGWSGPLKLQVNSEQKYQWLGITHHLPAPNGVDDTDAIQAALDLAQAGDTVKLKAGTYLINDRLDAPSGISFDGAGKHQTIVKTLPGACAYPRQSMMWIKGGASRVRNMQFISTVDMSRYAVITGRGYLIDPRPEGLIFENLIIDSKSSDDQQNFIKNVAISFANIDDVSITNCDMIGGQAVVATKCQQVFVRNNRHKGNLDLAAVGNNGGTAYAFNSCVDLDFSHNDIRSLDRSINTFTRRGFVTQTHNGVAYNNYLGENTLYNISPLLHPSIDQNTGEQILLECHGSKITSKPSKVNNRMLTFSEHLFEADTLITHERLGWNDGEGDASIAIIVSGPGAGQWRKIIANTTNTVTLDRPWDMKPSTESTIHIAEACFRYTFYKNSIKTNMDDDQNGVPDHLDFDSRFTFALSAIQLYGSVNECIVADNDIQGMRQAVQVWGFIKRGSAASQIDILNNQIDDVYRGIHLRCSLGVHDLPNEHYEDAPLIMMVNARDNIISNVEGQAYHNSGLGRWTKYYPGVWSRSNVFQHHQVSDAKVGIELNRHQMATLCHDNQFTLSKVIAGSRGYILEGVDTQPHLHNNSIDPKYEQFVQSLSNSKHIVAAWNFEQDQYHGSFGDVGDDSLNQIKSQSFGGLTSSQGRIGKAARFDGVDDSVRIQTPFQFTDFTVSAWFKINGDSSGSSHYVYSTDSMINRGVRGLCFFYAGRYIRVIGENPGADQRLTWDVRPFKGDQQWHYVAVTYNANSGHLAVYGDGELKDSAYVDLGRWSPQNSEGKPLHAFLGSRSAKDNFFNGDIDEVKIYQSHMSESQIQELYRGPIVHIPFDETSFTGFQEDVKDLNASGYNGKSIGAVESQIGLKGESARFDGQSSYITMEQAFKLKSFSISTWFKINGSSSGSSHYVFASNALVNGGFKGISFFYAGYIIKVIGSKASNGNSLRWDVRPFAGDDQWHHITLTYDHQSHDLKVYGDGILKDSMNIDLGDVAPLGSDGKPTPVHFGARTSKDNFFNGQVDEFKLWDRPLSDTEVSELYESF